MGKGKNDNWQTPRWLFESLRSSLRLRTGKLFSVDVAASAENALLPNYIDEDMNALDINEPWAESGAVCFCNPPFSIVGHFTRAALYQQVAYDVRTLMIVPVRTDREWWHQIVLGKRCDIQFYKGRIPFINPDPDAKKGGSAFMYNANLLFGLSYCMPSWPVSIDVDDLRRKWEREKQENS